MRWCTVRLLLGLFAVTGAPPAWAQGIAGTYVLSQGDTTLTLVLSEAAEGTLAGTLTSSTGARFELEGLVADGVGMGALSDGRSGSYFEAHPEPGGLVLALIEPGPDGMPDYTRVQQLPFRRQGGSGPPAAAGPPAPPPGTGAGGSPGLAQEIAGLWWGYSGSTERAIGLCADGTYHDSWESGYSGRSFDSTGGQTMAWGTANQGGGAGRWTIAGDYQGGTIRVVYGDGRAREIGYRRGTEAGCLLFDGNLLCRKSRACR